MSRARRRAAGFTLIELAVVLLVVTLLLGSLLVPLSKQVEQRNIQDTDRLGREALEALMGFAMANGRFPCPAVAGATGVEAFDAAGGTPVNGKCRTNFGFLPGVTLGLSRLDAQGYALDGWGSTTNRLRYGVSGATVNGVANVFTSSQAGGPGMRLAGIAALSGAVQQFLSVCASSVGIVGAAPPTCGAAGSANALADGTAVVVVLSLGANGNLTGGGGVPANADELVNFSSTGAYVSRTASGQVQGNAAAEFDDQVYWLALPTVISRMVSAGQLP